MFSIFKLNFIIKLPFIYLSVSTNALAKKMISKSNIVKLVGEDDSEAIDSAVKVLKVGGVVALPTDTVYGLAVDATNSAAIKYLYQVKKRDFQKPLAICVDKVSEIDKWGVTDNLPNGLLSELLPGPVTVLLNRTLALNSHLNPGVLQVGVRVIPGFNTSFASNVATVLGKPIALTSANPSNLPSCTSVNEFKALWPLINLICDAGTIDNESRDGSTIVDLSIKGKYKIVRSGIALKTVLKLLDSYGLVE